MRVLITGNMGYVGSVLVDYLSETHPEWTLVGFDSGFFAHSITAAERLPETRVSEQFFGDVRDLGSQHLEDVDAVVHLAAVSNDPMGKEFEGVTGEINRQASVRIAKLSAEVGVRNFVFASSCSMYGAADGPARKETDPTAPQTAYAKSKIGTETDLREADLGNMVFTSLRFATACGMSNRLRLDLVLNDFVASAIWTGKIVVLSDGTPWRPLIDVRDMARAITWGVTRAPSVGGQWLAINTGRGQNNVRISDLAYSVQRAFPGTAVEINTEAPPDRRSYKVDFSLFEGLAPEALPQETLDQSVAGLAEGIRALGIRDAEFRESPMMRLNVLRAHIASGRLSDQLRWRN